MTQRNVNYFSVYAELLQSCLTLCNPLDLPGPLYMGFPRQEYWSGKVVLRWQKNRTGIPLSPQQIHHKNIWTLSKFHKTTFECRQRTSGTQKAAHYLQKEVGKNVPDTKRYKWGRDRDPSWDVGLKKREVSKHQEALSLASLWRALESQRAT